MIKMKSLPRATPRKVWKLLILKSHSVDRTYLKVQGVKLTNINKTKIEKQLLKQKINYLIEQIWVEKQYEKLNK